MKNNPVLDMLLSSSDGYISGESMSRTLGVSRAAVWKQITALREAGYEIEAVPRRGYRLLSAPDCLSTESILRELGQHPWADRVIYMESVSSTNTLLKRMAEDGKPAGTVLLAGQQTGGRGRLGRAFLSPPDTGIYLSVLLRPECSPDKLSHVTALAAVAVADAVKACCGLEIGIKWPNDIVCRRKKLGGILTELSVEWETARTEYLVIGIGINCSQKREDFPEELQETAASLSMMTGEKMDRSRLAACLIRSLSTISLDAEANAQWLQRYRAQCITIGQQVRILQAGQERFGRAVGVDDSFALLVEFADGHQESVFTGEVSVRGMYGYAD